MADIFSNLPDIPYFGVAGGVMALAVLKYAIMWIKEWYPIMRDTLKERKTMIAERDKLVLDREVKVFELSDKLIGQLNSRLKQVSDDLETALKKLGDVEGQHKECMEGQARLSRQIEQLDERYQTTQREIAEERGCWQARLSEWELWLEKQGKSFG